MSKEVEATVIKRKVSKSKVGESQATSTDAIAEETVLVDRPSALDHEALTALTDLYRSGTLTELLQWYHDTKGEVIILKMPERRPVFKGKPKNTGIKISEPILRSAVDKAKTERLRTGGSLSKLVEYLLWVYIGSPKELIEEA
jgi:hypothetical protein